MKSWVLARGIGDGTEPQVVSRHWRASSARVAALQLRAELAAHERALVGQRTLGRMSLVDELPPVPGTHIEDAESGKEWVLDFLGQRAGIVAPGPGGWQVMVTEVASYSHDGQIDCRAPGKITEWSHKDYADAVSYVRRAFGEDVIASRFPDLRTTAIAEPGAIRTDSTDGFVGLVCAASAATARTTPFDTIAGAGDLALLAGQRGDGSILHTGIPMELQDREQLGAIAEAAKMTRIAISYVNASVPIADLGSMRATSAAGWLQLMVIAVDETGMHAKVAPLAPTRASQQVKVLEWCDVGYAGEGDFNPIRSAVTINALEWSTWQSR